MFGKPFLLALTIRFIVHIHRGRDIRMTHDLLDQFQVRLVRGLLQFRFVRDVRIPPVIERQLAFDFNAIQLVFHDGLLHLTQAFAPRLPFRNRIGFH